MKRVNKDGFDFEFNDAVLEVIEFDSPEYHGLNHAMKAVDLVAELPNEYLYIELKDYTNHNAMLFRCPYQSKKSKVQCDKADEYSQLRKICADIRSKFYETLLYWYAENRIDKPISCIAMAKMDSAMLYRLNEQLKSQIPIGIPKGVVALRWEKELFRNLVVVNPKRWNELFAEKYCKCG